MTTRKLDKAIIFRFLISIVLGTVALGIFLLNRDETEGPAGTGQPELTGTPAEIDREVDSVLAHFGIEKSWIRKSRVLLPNSHFFRTERRVATPREVVPVMVNAALNAMAKRYNGRAVASENLKEGSVMIYIELDGIVIQSIILKPNPSLKRLAPREAQTKT